MQLPSGVIADTLRTRTSAVFGNLISSLGSIIFGLSPTFETACIGRFFSKSWNLSDFHLHYENSAVWFHERVFGIMSDLTLLIGNLGSVLAASPLAAILTHYEWRSAFIGIGCVSLCLSLLSYLIVRNRQEDLSFIPPNNFMIKKSSGNQQ